MQHLIYSNGAAHGLKSGKALFGGELAVATGGCMVLFLDLFSDLVPVVHESLSPGLALGGGDLAVVVGVHLGDEPGDQGLLILVDVRLRHGGFELSLGEDHVVTGGSLEAFLHTLNDLSAVFCEPVKGGLALFAGDAVAVVFVGEMEDDLGGGDIDLGALVLGNEALEEHVLGHGLDLDGLSGSKKGGGDGSEFHCSNLFITNDEARLKTLWRIPIRDTFQMYPS